MQTKFWSSISRCEKLLKFQCWLLNFTNSNHLIFSARQYYTRFWRSCAYHRFQHCNKIVREFFSHFVNGHETLHSSGNISGKFTRVSRLFVPGRLVVAGHLRLRNVTRTTTVRHSSKHEPERSFISFRPNSFSRFEWVGSEFNKIAQWPLGIQSRTSH